MSHQFCDFKCIATEVFEAIDIACGGDGGLMNWVWWWCVECCFGDEDTIVWLKNGESFEIKDAYSLYQYAYVEQE